MSTWVTCAECHRVMAAGDSKCPDCGSQAVHSMRFGAPAVPAVSAGAAQGAASASGHPSGARAVCCGFCGFTFLAGEYADCPECGEQFGDGAQDVSPPRTPPAAPGAAGAPASSSGRMPGRAAARHEGDDQLPGRIHMRRSLEGAKREADEERRRAQPPSDKLTAQAPPIAGMVEQLAKALEDSSDGGEVAQGKASKPQSKKEKKRARKGTKREERTAASASAAAAGEEIAAAADAGDFAPGVPDVSQDKRLLLASDEQIKDKIAHVFIALPRAGTLEVSLGEDRTHGTSKNRGTSQQRQRAQRFINAVRERRVGPVAIKNLEDTAVAFVNVPSSCVGIVTGTEGSFLRQMQKDFNSMMFFLDYDPKPAKKRASEILVIIGEERCSRIAELKVMSVIETQQKGYFTSDLKGGDEGRPEWGERLVSVTKEQMGWILGRKEAARQKLVVASGAVVECVGAWVYILGDQRRRHLAAEYLDWALQQRDGKAVCVVTDGRDDVTVLEVPNDCIAHVTRQQRSKLNSIEEQWGVITVFLDGKEERRAEGSVRLAIFGKPRARRGAELKVMSAVETKRPGHFTNGVADSKCADDWGTDTFVLHDRELRYVLGDAGRRRKILAAASHCILEIVGTVAYFSGEREERRRARRNMKWMLDRQRTAEGEWMQLEVGPGDTDVTSTKIRNRVAFREKVQALRMIEEQTETFCFIATDEVGARMMVICGHNPEGREEAMRFVELLLGDGPRPSLQDAEPPGTPPAAAAQMLGHPHEDLRNWVFGMQVCSGLADAGELATLIQTEHVRRQRLELEMQGELCGIHSAAWDDYAEHLRRVALFTAVEGAHSRQAAALAAQAGRFMAKMLDVKHTLKVSLPEALDNARLARTNRFKIEGGSGDLSGQYLRIRTQHGSTAWRRPEPEAYLQALPGALLWEGDTESGRASLSAVIPCDPSLPCGSASVVLPGGSRGTLLAARGGAPALALPDGVSPGDLRALVALPQRLAPLAGSLDTARTEATQRAAELAVAQESVAQSKDPAADGSAEQRDAARSYALDAHLVLLEHQQSAAVQQLASPEFEEELAELEQRLAGQWRGDELGAGADVDSAAAAASTALSKLSEWQASYDSAVAAAERRTDAAVSAAQRWGEEGHPPEHTDLMELAAAIEQAAAEESALRVRADGVTPPPRAECAAAVRKGLWALSAALSAVQALRAQCAEAAAVREELAEGVSEAEGGRFADRVARLNAPDPCAPRAAEGSAVGKARQALEAVLVLEGRLPREQWEAMCAALRQNLAEAEAIDAEVQQPPGSESLRKLQEDADVLCVKISHADPERAAELVPQRDDILRRLRGLRRARGEEAAELLRLARLHFPERIRDVCQGLHQQLVSQLASKRASALRLVVGGGSLSDYVKVGSLTDARGHSVIRAESGSGTVIIKQVRIDSGPALDSFARGVRMMDAAGDVAAAVRSVFISDEWGCIVMEDYPHDLTSWSAEANAANLSPDHVLQMVHKLLGCIVRLHSASAEFPDGIVHGDIAPGNVVVDHSGQPRFIDFELSHADASKSTVVPTRGMTPAYAAPELRFQGVGPRDPDKEASKMSDVFGAGAVLQEMLRLPHVREASGPVADMLLPLCRRMTLRSPEERPSASAALAASELAEALELRRDDRLGEIEQRLRDAAEETRRAKLQRAELRALSSELEGAKADMERQRAALRADAAETEAQLQSRAAAVADAAAARQRELEQRAAELQREAERVAAEERRLEAEAKQMGVLRRRAREKEDELRGKQAKMKQAFCESPKHWSGELRVGQGWCAVPVPEASAVFAALADALRPDPEHFRPGGRDFHEPGTHTKLVLQHAWMIEDPLRWQQYALARSAVLCDLRSERLPKKHLAVRQALVNNLGPGPTPLPEMLQNGRGLNEVRLLHATSPGLLLGILHHGFNPRLAGSTAGTAFGCGTYLAEDPGKCDQYATSHTAGQHPDLERRLYHGRGVEHGKVHYMLVCRVTAGCFAVTKDGRKQADGKQLWAAEPKAGWKGADPRRELDYAPGGIAGCRARYSSLLVETAPKRSRYREFVVFDPQRLYGEYLLAYTREE
eukprot:TRINITY_DN528_c0_g1_i10.p1 TRINITY_DN528_c0_g1~~TRINITY_DN528_c0_g1_i10.p1  ORF type:complete len:2077 (+),score=563.26 TRINITY_DN528_c0_g1_i10:95-6325(+)